MNPHTGLSAAEAADRLILHGPNELPGKGGRNFVHIVTDVLREPMFALLLGSGVIYMLLGDRMEALLLLIFASLSVGIAVIQETRSEHVIEALRDLTSPRALVIRDGIRVRIPGREVVPGDILALSEGDRVPADAIVLEASELQLDESLLTGESVPVRKRALAKDEPRTATLPGGDDLPFVFSGTLVVRGMALTEVAATGPGSEIGKIGDALNKIETVSPRLARQTARIVRISALIGGICCIAVVVLFGLMRGTWLNALLAGLSLGMSMLPEEFPLVLTVFMVMGAWRISRARVLTRRTSAIETLGEATVICTDKTGTLTENKMTISALRTAGDAWVVKAPKDIPVAWHGLISAGAWASPPEAWDPMDRAFHELAVATTSLRGGTLLKSWGLTPELLAVTFAWQTPAGEIRIAAKGAPEAIAGLCRLDADQHTELIGMINEMAARGMRVLGIAEASATLPLPETPGGFTFTFLGLAGLSDPIRPQVPAAVRECRTAGIRVIMITGDFPMTARVVAEQAGIETGTVLDGPAIAGMNDAELQAAVLHTGVFARIVPAQKLRIVQALKAGGAVVAMTGDGVNDAPALKAADIGIAMGGRGADVAREAASLVLLDDDFGSMVHTIRLGRRIYDNLRKAMAYIVAVHVPIAGLALLPLVTGLPMIFAPVHIAFLEMVIDPVCSMVFEAEEDDEGIMNRPPRSGDSHLFSRALVVWSIIQGLTALLPLAAIYWLAMKRKMPEDDARALTFVSLVMVDLVLVLINRSFTPIWHRRGARTNKPLIWVTLTATALMSLVLATSAGHELFRFGSLHPDDLALAAGTMAGVAAVLELLKYFWHKRLEA